MATPNFTPSNQTVYTLPRPYATLTPEDASRRLCCRVPLADWSLFATLYPVPGAIEATLTTLIHGIADELRHHNITSWSTHNQCAFVAHIRRCAALTLTQPELPRDEFGGGTTLGGTTPLPAEESSTSHQQNDRGDIDQA